MDEAISLAKAFVLESQVTARPEAPTLQLAQTRQNSIRQQRMQLQHCQVAIMHQQAMLQQQAVQIGMGFGGVAGMGMPMGGMGGMGGMGCMGGMGGMGGPCLGMGGMGMPPMGMGIGMGVGTSMGMPPAGMVHMGFGRGTAATAANMGPEDEDDDEDYEGDSGEQSEDL